MNMSIVLSKKCNIELQNFVDVLRSSATVFDEFEMELNRIVIHIGNLSSKLAILENIKYVFGCVEQPVCFDWHL